MNIETLIEKTESIMKYVDERDPEKLSIITALYLKEKLTDILNILKSDKK